MTINRISSDIFIHTNRNPKEHTATIKICYSLVLKHMIILKIRDAHIPQQVGVIRSSCPDLTASAKSMPIVIFHNGLSSGSMKEVRVRFSGVVKIYIVQMTRKGTRWNSKLSRFIGNSARPVAFRYATIAGWNYGITTSFKTAGRFLWASVTIIIMDMWIVTLWRIVSPGSNAQLLV